MAAFATAFFLSELEEQIMISLRKSSERGHIDYGWLDTYHTFSFAGFYDPEQMGFSFLRVINDDRVAPGEGFPWHHHSNMEIITYVVEGSLEHSDNMSNGSVIHAGEVQRISAGRGIIHSEYNPSRDKPVHFLQIWILPENLDTEPGYEQRRLKKENMRANLCLVASPDGKKDSLTIQPDVSLFAAILKKGESVSHFLAPRRRAYIHVIRGAAVVNEQLLKAGDGARIVGTRNIDIKGRGEAEVLLFDLP
jgi:hypothetical protein